MTLLLLHVLQCSLCFSQLPVCFLSAIKFSTAFAALRVLGGWPLLLDFSEMSQYQELPTCLPACPSVLDVSLLLILHFNQNLLGLQDLLSACLPASLGAVLGNQTQGLTHTGRLTALVQNDTPSLTECLFEAFLLPERRLLEGHLLG